MELTFREYFPYVHHDAVVPELVDGRDPVRHRVVIAGGGPTGLATALGLARYGVPSVVLEVDDTVCSGSRAGAITRRTLDIFAQLGIIEPALRTGFTWSEGRTFYRDQEVYSFSMPHDDDQRFPPGMSLQQNYVEQYLVDEVERHADLIEVRWQSEVEGVRQTEGGVELDVRTPAERYTLAADWVVACDGGRSEIRRRLGLQLGGTAYEGKFVIIDIRIDTEGFPIGRRCWFDPPSNPGSTLLMYTKPDDMVRFDYQLLPDEDVEEAMRPESVLPRVEQHLKMMGVDRPWEPVWMSLYQANALTLDDYVHGRVLFAGDAAHLVPIFGVRGMNSSLDDAHNLAWKLALVAQGRAPRELLDSYSAERVFAARENLRLASKGAEFMAPPSRPATVLRDAVLSLSERHPWIATLLDPRQHSSIPLVASPLNVPDADGWSAGPRPGHILAEFPVTIRDADGERAGHLTDLIGAHATVLLATEDGAVPEPVAAAVAAIAERMPIRVRTLTPAEDHTGRLLPAYDLAGPGPAAYLVRPDGHVQGRWKGLGAADLAAAITRAADLITTGGRA